MGVEAPSKLLISPASPKKPVITPVAPSCVFFQIFQIVISNMNNATTVFS
jgi:hypothetical protein